MKKIMSEAQIRDGNDANRESGVGSAECAGHFTPAFLDFSTMTVYVSRFADGRPAPIHVVEGLPPEVIAKATLVAGFERGGFFYTRRAVARACAEWRL